MVVCKQTLVFIFCPLVEMNKNLDIFGSINFEPVQGDLRLFIVTIWPMKCIETLNRRICGHSNSQTGTRTGSFDKICFYNLDVGLDVVVAVPGKE